MRTLGLFLLVGAGCLVAQQKHRTEFEGWLTREATRYWDQRDAAIAGLQTRAEIETRQKFVRETALRLIGGLPERKTPLASRVTGSFARDGYRVENVVFESQPGFRVTANLYLPTRGQGPYPAVLGVAGHSTNGKASATYQHAFIGFAQRGIAVLAYDPPGQGERLEYLDAATGNSRAGIGVGEHIMAGVPSLLVGMTIARHFVWDGIRALDYLLTRPEIDARRIAVAGNSGGGTQAAYLAMFEPRLANAISSCYMTSWRELWGGPGPQDSEQIWPGMLANGLDFGDFALAAAPRPFLMTTAIRDYFPIAGARATHRQTMRLFDLLGNGANLGFFEYDDTHGWSQPRREAAYRWLEKHFFGRETDGAEGKIDTEEEGLLYATPTGALASSMGSRTMRELALDRARELAQRRKPPTVETVRKAIGWVEPAAVTQVVDSGRDGDIEIVVEGGVRIPAKLQSASGRKPSVVFLPGAGNRTDPDIAELVGEGYPVLTLYPRGSGPGYSSGGASGYRLDYQIAARAWLLGRNLPAMQAADIVSAVRYLKQKYPASPVLVIAKGRMGPAALLASRLEPAVDRLLLEGGIVSWQALLESAVQQGWDSVVIPGVLEHFDLPDLKQMVGAPGLLELSPVTPAGNVIRGAGVKLRGEGWSLRQAAGLFLQADRQ